MRISILPALALGLLWPAIAQAEDAPATSSVQTAEIPSRLTGTLTFESRYIETETFNDAFSDKPSFQARVNYDLGKGFYVYGYAYTGVTSTRPFKDASSEFGFEVGKEFKLTKKATLTLAAGRFADYGGQGFKHGDWYGKAIIAYGRVSFQVMSLHGDTDSVLLSGSYTLPIGKATLRPSVVYFTATGAVNPGLDANLPVAKHVTVGLRLVLPDHGGSRKLYMAGTLAVHF